MDWGNLIGLGSMVGGAAGGIFNSFMQKETAQELAKDQYKYAQKLMKSGAGYSNRLAHYAYMRSRKLAANDQRLEQAGYYENPKIMRQGLERAGFNPMLITSANFGSVDSPVAGSGSISGGSAGMPSTPNFDVLGSMTDAYRTFKLDKKMNDAQVKNVEAMTKNTNAKTLTEGYNQYLLNSQMLLNTLDAQLKKKELNWYDKVKLSETKSLMINALANQAQSEASKMNAFTSRSSYHLQKSLSSVQDYYNKRLLDNESFDSRIFRNFDRTRRVLFGR